jgi:16S rRNA processing protein RimM
MERGARAGEALVCLGQIGAPHGVRGEVRLRSFTAEPEAIAGYGPLQTEDGRAIEIEALRPAKDHFVATLAGVHDRDAAAQLANAKLYAPRERLPQLVDPEEFYYADLIGLAVVNRGERIGEVVALHNFGAGDLIEVRLDAAGRTELLAFNDANVPNVDIAAGTIVIDPPADWFSPTPDVGENDGAAPLSGKRGG